MGGIESGWGDRDKRSVPIMKTKCKKRFFLNGEAIWGHKLTKRSETQERLKEGLNDDSPDPVLRERKKDRCILAFLL